MHVLMVTGAGIVFLALTVGLAAVLKRPFSALLPGFLILWAVGAALNMYIGVAHAGYSIAEEAPIFLIIFGIPAALALLWARRS
jgi:hypothetical protein